MSEPGYLYVLANSSMPDLVKVGKTTRSPSKRADELSGVSGVATPFIVVYEQFFQDCDSAESFVHALLSQKGFRISEGREFFKAPVSEVVKAIIQAPGGAVPKQHQTQDELLAINADQNDDLEDMELSTDETSEPWQNIFDEAENYYLGLEDYIEDEAEALRLYREAAKLGCLMAYDRIGDIYANGGDSITEDDQKALEYYKAGVRKGNYQCYMSMAKIFHNRGNEANYRKCIRLFVSEVEKGRNSSLEQFRSYTTLCREYVWLCMLWKIDPLEEMIPLLRQNRDKILVYAEACLKSLEKDNEHPDDESYNSRLRLERTTVDWIRALPAI